MTLVGRAERSSKNFDLSAALESNLLDLDLGAGGFDLFLDLFRFFLGDTFLESLGCSLDKCLGFGKPETGNCGTDLFDDCDLVPACVGEDHVERCFFLDWSCGGTATGSGSNGHWSRGANAPFFFELFDEVGDLKNGEAAELIDEC